jgi:uncharacterized protein (TIGR00255 family)
MIYSMTAYASRELKVADATAQWEIRSVNHRYLELSFKLPESLRMLETTLRDIARHQLNRGKVECFLKFEWEDSLSSKLLINDSLVDALTAACERIMERLPAGKVQTLSPLDILKWPAVVRTPEKDITQVAESIQASFTLVLQDLVAGRAREGVKLQGVIQERLIKMREYVNHISKRQPEIQKNYRLKFIEKLKGLAFEVDKNRFEQEMVYLIQKMDISEELDRLSIHLTEVERILKTEKLIGRRLDFLMQELNRETNTIASKAIDGASTQDSVELKVLIEEMREQIQNLE